MSFKAPTATGAAILSEPQSAAFRQALMGSTYTGPHLMARGPAIAFAPDTDAGGGGAGPLSLDAAISLLSASETEPADEDAGEPDADNAALDENGDDGAPDGEPEAEDEQQLEASDQEAGDDDAPEDDPASEDGAEDDEGEPEEPAIDPPKFWSAEEKAVFAKAPHDVQLLIAAKDQAAEKRVYEAKEEAAAARKEASVIAEIKAIADQHFERAQTIFQGKWDGVDWAAWAKENPQEAFQAKIEHDQELEELNRLKTVQAATEAEEHRHFLASESAKLKESGHVLADPEKGKAEKQKLVAYAQASNVPPESLKWAGAVELTILHKAMLYDELQARITANPPKPKPKNPAKLAQAAAPAPKPNPGPVRPAAAAPPRKSVIQRQSREVVRRAFDTGRRTDVLAALAAIGE